MNIKEIKVLSDEQLSNIIKNNKNYDKEIILASVEKGERDYKKGKYYPTEEVRNRILEKSILVRRSN